ncbi:hypothetical protein GCK32_008668 [Trichostrongylus colubriformis]|uniref:Uncharacterized protein n=1 Tax=Trichostrongylus colubriformis TaxID=6319 RepID=A0AAN8FS51_TRICO
MEYIEKSLADHHEFVKQTAGPTNLVLQPEHVDELLKQIMTSSTEMQSNLEERMDNTKNRIHMELNEMFKEVNRCRTEVEKASNNAVMHEVRELSTRLAAFQTEVTQRFKALEKKLDQLSDIASMLRRIDSQLEESDGGDSETAKEDAMRQRLRNQSDSKCIDDDLALNWKKRRRKDSASSERKNLKQAITRRSEETRKFWNRRRVWTKIFAGPSTRSAFLATA